MGEGMGKGGGGGKRRFPREGYLFILMVFLFYCTC
jgi:hypothetical protein